MAKNTSTRRKRSSSRKKKPSGPISSISQWFGSLSDPASRHQNWSLFTWTVVLLSAAALIACLSYFFTGNADQSETEVGVAQAHKVHNWLGPIGAWIADIIIRQGFGVFGILIPLFGLFMGLLMFEDDPEYYSWARSIFKYVAFFLFFGSIFLSFIEWLIDPAKVFWGGGVGLSINLWLVKYLGKVGLAFLLLSMIIVFVVINFNVEVRTSSLVERLKDSMPGSEGRAHTNRYQPKSFKERIAGLLGVETVSAAANRPINPPKKRVKREKSSKETEPKEEAKRPNINKEVSLELSQPDMETAKKQAEKSPDGQLELTIVETKDEPKMEMEIIAPTPEAQNQPAKELEQIGEDNIGRVVGEENKVEKIVPKEDQEIENAEELFADEDFDPTLELSDYQKPVLELLEDHGAGQGREVNRQELEENKNKILQTLGDYGIEIKSIKATIGPTVTLYEIVPAAGVRISKIRNLEDDIALGLAALGIRIIAPMPGKGTIGIEVPNSKPEIVSLRGVMSTEKFLAS
ncbi:MAG: DNA translocase FtsK 4TM domain-containing protein, partial [Bacteroidota bacterium]